MTVANVSLSAQVWQSATATRILLAGIAVIAMQVLLQIIRHRLFSPIKHYPGPFWASVTRLWIAWHCAKSTELAAYEKLHEKYGGSYSTP